MTLQLETRTTKTVKLDHSSSSPRQLLRRLILVVAVISLSSCKGSIELSSQWTDHVIKVDGSGAEWKDSGVNIAGPDALVGIKNDSENLYVFIATANRSTQWQMLALGTTVWFDPEGKKTKSFGIRFPVSLFSQGLRLPMDIARLNPEDVQRVIEVSQRQFELLSAGSGEPQLITVDQGKGVDVRLGFAGGTLTLEMKVPLHRTATQPYAVGADAGNILAIGLETGDYAQAMRGRQSGSGRETAAPSGGRGGGRGGRGGGGGGAQGGGSMGGDAPEPLKHWLIVHTLSSGVPPQSLGH